MLVIVENEYDQPQRALQNISVTQLESSNNKITSDRGRQHEQLKQLCRTPTHNFKISVAIAFLGCTRRAVDLWYSVLDSHPTLGEVHKTSSDHVFKSACFECRCISC